MTHFSVACLCRMLTLTLHTTNRKDISEAFPRITYVVLRQVATQSNSDIV